MTDSELAARLREVAVAGYERWRRQKGWGAIVTPTPHRLIDEIAAGLAPVLRDLVDVVVDDRLNPGGFSSGEVHIQEFVPGNGHRQAKVTHQSTGVSAVGHGEAARRAALLTLRDLAPASA